MTVTNREAEQWNRIAHAAAMRKIIQDRQEAVAAYVRQHQSNTPEGASGCSQAVVSQEGRAAAARGSRPQSFAGMNSARATVSTCVAAPEKTGTNSLTPHAAVGAGLGSSQGRLF